MQLLLFLINNISTWVNWQIGVFYSLVITGLEIVARLVFPFGNLFKRDIIPTSSKHLEEFSELDKMYVAFNKCITPIFTFHTIRYVWNSPSHLWKITELNLTNTIVSLITLFIIYEFFYYTFHRILHLKSIYPWVHKHHHRQISPTRGQNDAVNVHPFEFVVGEYNHLFAIFLNPFDTHIFTVLIFIVGGGLLASLNHTRYNVFFNLGPFVLYDVKSHDIHHRYPTWNYGQYTMFWDRLFVTFKNYEKIVD